MRQIRQILAPLRVRACMHARTLTKSRASVGIWRIWRVWRILC